MSIISDALARLQSERARLFSGRQFKDHRLSGDEKSYTSGIKSVTSGGRRPSRKLGMLFMSALVLLALGIGSFWWGMTLVSEVPEVPSALPGREGPLQHSQETDGKDSMTPQLPASVESPQVSPSEKVPRSFSEPDHRLAQGPDSVPIQNPAASQGGPSLEPVGKNPLPAVPSSPPHSPSVQSKKSQPRTLSRKAVPSETDTSLLPSSSRKGITTLPSSIPPKSVPPLQSPVIEEPVREMKEALSPPPLKKTEPSSLNAGGRSLSQPKPTSLDVLTLGQRLIQKHQYEKAVTLLHSLFVIPPDNWEPWFWMGTAKLGLGQLDEADRYFLEGLARNSSIPQLWIHRALVGQQQGRYSESIDMLRQAELLAPDIPEIPLNLAYSFETRGNREVAFEYYRKFLTMTEGLQAYWPARKIVLQRLDRLFPSSS